MDIYLENSPLLDIYGFCDFLKELGRDFEMKEKTGLCEFGCDLKCWGFKIFATNFNLEIVKNKIKDRFGPELWLLTEVNHFNFI
jgi:hypothetical protein